MAKPEWGTKRICPNCGARYYDLRKDPPVCPSCSTAFDPEALLRSRRSRPAPVEETRKAPVETEDEEVLERSDVEVNGNDDDVGVDDIEEDTDDTTQEEDEVMIEDASELGEEDDMGVDVEGDDEEP
ncbi:MAG TPA: TIGR02300 family protein [Arenibaculum sp.]|nr:TIGR02300 family protein [Arenibaculum sp.]